MIEELLGQRFPNEYGLSYDCVHVLVNTAKGNVVLSDKKACAQCRNILPEHNNVDNNMLAFMQTPSSASSTLNEMVSVLGHDFKFVQVKYPSAYIW